MRLSTRRIMVVVALVALNLAAALATAKQYPRKRFHGPSAIGSGRGMYIYGDDGSVVFVPGSLENTGAKTFASRPHILIRGPVRLPTLLEIWAPVLAGAAVTILAVVIALRSRVRRRVGRAGDGRPRP